MYHSNPIKGTIPKAMPIKPVWTNAKTIVETHHTVELPKKYLFANDYNKDDTSNDNISDNTKWCIDAQMYMQRTRDFVCCMFTRCTPHTLIHIVSVFVETQPPWNHTFKHSTTSIGSNYVQWQPLCWEPPLTAAAGTAMVVGYTPAWLVASVAYRNDHHD